MYVATFISGSLIMTGLGLDLVSACSAVAATLGNVGPGFKVVGPAFTYQHTCLWEMGLECVHVAGQVRAFHCSGSLHPGLLAQRVSGFSRLFQGSSGIITQAII